MLPIRKKLIIVFSKNFFYRPVIHIGFSFCLLNFFGFDFKKPHILRLKSAETFKKLKKKNCGIWIK